MGKLTPDFAQLCLKEMGIEPIWVRSILLEAKMQPSLHHAAPLEKNVEEHEMTLESVEKMSAADRETVVKVHDVMSSSSEASDWLSLQEKALACQACALAKTRHHVVFGVGDQQADWLLIGEGPGEQEDLQGEPFVGPAGQLLNNMLNALQLKRGFNVYLANVIKCRPPKNRNPLPDEIAACESYLKAQIALVQPKIIIALGRIAAHYLLNTQQSMASLRGRVHQYQSIPVISTYHPAYLLRRLEDKAKAWQDLQLAYTVYQQQLHHSSS